MNPSHSVAISSSTAISYLSCSCTRTHRMPTKLDPFRSPAGSHRRDIDEGWWPVSLTPPNTRTHARAYWSTGVYDSKVRRMFDNAWVDSWIGAPVTSDYRLRMRIYEGSSVATTGMSLIHKLSVKWGLRWRFRNARLRAVSTVANERRTGVAGAVAVDAGCLSSGRGMIDGPGKNSRMLLQNDGRLQYCPIGFQSWKRFNNERI